VGNVRPSRPERTVAIGEGRDKRLSCCENNPVENQAPLGRSCYPSAPFRGTRWRISVERSFLRCGDGRYSFGRLVAFVFGGFSMEGRVNLVDFFVFIGRGILIWALKGLIGFNGGGYLVV
jgi:hypothetical protein